MRATGEKVMQKRVNILMLHLQHSNVGTRFGGQDDLTKAAVMASPGVGGPPFRRVDI